jgi:F-type H+-transporting ATPase subunit a
VVTGIIVGGLMILISFAARAALGNGEVAVTPAGRFSLKGMFESMIEFIVGISDLVIGEEGRKFVPLFAAIFFYILFSNLIGLIPGIIPATDNINTTFALGIVSFFIYNIFGLKENGASYLKHFLGPVLWLFPMMLPIELFSHAIRPLTLGLRLQGNIMADHMVLSVFLDLFDKAWFIPIPVVFYGMGVFVSCMQAFVFTMLSMIYVSVAVAHDH